MLVVSGARKVFHPGSPDEKRALDGVDLTLSDGDFCVVIGSNGAGKSSLLNAVSGALTLDEGQIEIDGIEVTSLPVHRRATYIARVFQDPMLGTAASMTVAENLLLAELRGKAKRLTPALTRARRARYADQLATLGLGLEQRLDARVELLSGGQRQSLSLIMAVSSQPRLLLLDEHTAALDPRTAAVVMAATVRAVASLRLTALMVTHNMEQALAHGNRLVMMEAGRIKLAYAGDDKRRLTVSDLIRNFAVKSDRLLLEA